MPVPRVNAFAQLNADARTHYALHLQGAVLCLLRHLTACEAATGRSWQNEFTFLQKYQEQAREHLGVQGLDVSELLHRWRVELAAWSSCLPNDLPLRALQAADGLTSEHLFALVLAGLSEEDSRFGTVFSRLQEPLTTRKLGIELAGQILSVPGQSGNPEGWRLYEQLAAAGLLRIANPDAPRAEWLLQVPATIFRVCRGEPLGDAAVGIRHHPASGFADPDDLILPAELKSQLRALPGLLDSGAVTTLIIRGMAGSGRFEVLGALARALGRGVLSLAGEEDRLPETSLAELGPLCLLTGSLPAFRYDCAPGQTIVPPTLKGYTGPRAILLGTEGGIRGSAEERTISLTLPRAGLSERLAHWRRHLNGYPISDLNTIVERLLLPPGFIRRAARSALVHAQLDGARALGLDHVRRACRELGHERLDALAERLEASGDWGNLVVAPGTMSRLISLEDRCRHRERLLHHLGQAFHSSPCGVRALFTGPSGTGKTLAARLLAAVLEKDLYRLDLASVVNKYIGETEKNLHRVLSRAEELDVILLLDEGDALLGSRTQVRSANDRYANLETDYLLQRLEHYQGILLVTSNLGEHIDPAFRRRMDLVIEFARPRREERRQLWDLHLPHEHQVDLLFLEEVALQCPFTGGQIRNAVAAAALLALRQRRVPLNRHHVLEAICDECRKAGLLAPALDSPERVPAGMAGFVHQ